MRQPEPHGTERAGGFHDYGLHGHTVAGKTGPVICLVGRTQTRVAIRAETTEHDDRMNLEPEIRPSESLICEK